MSNMDERIREALEQMADEVPHHGSVPSQMVRRARRRVALNSVAIGALIVALGAGAFAGVRALTETKSSGFTKLPPASSAPPAATASSPAPATISPCTAGQLRATGSLSGAAGSRVGGIQLQNYSDRTCTLTGTPVIKLSDANGKAITSGVTFSSSPAQWMADATPRPAAWPVVTLAGQTSQSAWVRISWSNWCPQGRAAPLWRIEIPGSGTVDVVNGMDQETPPPCNGPGMPSTIDVGPFEPKPAR